MDSEYPHDGHQPPLLEELQAAANELHGALDRLEGWLNADTVSESLPETAARS